MPKTEAGLRPPLAVRAHLGVIDVGSNAIRLQVARVFTDGSFVVVHDEREAVRLGEEVFRTGELSSRAVKRALVTLSRYAQTAQRYGVARVRAVATSAVREANNGEFFTSEVEKVAGLRLETISGVQEAQLIARGVLSGYNARRGRAALVDIGGGSTEISIIDHGQAIFSQSLPLGSVRLTEVFCRSDPLLPGHERALREHVRDHLRQAMGSTPWENCVNVVGSAGTIGALANFIRGKPSQPRGATKTRTTFSVRELGCAGVALRKMSLARRRKTPGIEERRAEIVVAGAIILEEVCAALKARTVRVVRRGLRDGLMLEEVERLADDGVLDWTPRRRTSCNARREAN